jgi:PleD family two-component response regulator
VREKISLLGSTISTPVATEVPNYFQNRFLLHKQAIEYIDEAKKKKTPIAMLVAQIDGFDQIRLQSRPSTINSMLTQLTDLFMKSIANEDLVTLSSEGQLIGLLSNINEVESKKIAKLIQKKIRENPIQIEERSINLTLSFAISKLVTDEKSFNKTIQTANIALKKPSAKKGNIFSLDHELLG